MAKGAINLQKESGGIVKISPVDGTGVTEVTVPESGNLVSVDTAVTDNAIARFDGTTGKLQNSGVIIADTGEMRINNAPLVFNDGFGIVWGSGTSIGGNASVGTINFNTNGSEKAKIDVYGNLLLTSGTGALGYGTGAGGTVTQLTSKSTAVTLNKPSGTIITSNSALAPGSSVSFTVYNNLVTASDLVYVYGGSYSYFIDIVADNTSDENGKFNIRITNNSGMNFSSILGIKFVIIKGATA